MAIPFRSQRNDKACHPIIGIATMPASANEHTTDHILLIAIKSHKKSDRAPCMNLDKALMIHFPGMDHQGPGASD